MYSSFFKNEKIVFRIILLEIFLLVIFVLLSVYFLIKQSHGQESIGKAGQLRYNSYLLADQLRQSSDDLTRMVRTYAVTGNRMFEHYFRDILAIREGEKPRPINYERIYWDFMTVKEPKPPFQEGKIVPLERLMHDAGFTEREFQLMDEAKQRSDKLVSLENIAIHVMKGQFQDEQGEFTVIGKPNPQLAMQILFGEEYHFEKKSIMEPINNFLRLIDQRTSKNFEHAELQIVFYQKAMFFAFGALIFNGVLLFLTTKWHQSLMIVKLESDVEKRTMELSIKNQEIADKEERFKSLSDAAFEGIIISDEGKIIEVNNTMANMSGYSTTELVSMKAIDIVIPENREKVQENILSGYEEPYEVSVLKKDGSSFPIAASGKMFSYRGKQVRVTAIRDLTVEKKAEKNKIEKERLQGVVEMAGTVCHELNQPLQGLIGYSDLILANIDSENDTSQKLLKIIKQVERIDSITKKLMNITRYETRDYVNGERIIDLDKSSEKQDN